jgi:GT2 family glycosyltransferase
MTLSIIIVNWNTRALLADCLDSISRTAQDIDYEIIVSDNGSTDASDELCRERFPQAVFLANGSNLGFAAANNRGLAVARGDYCLLLNSDTVVLPGALQSAVAYLDKHAETGGLGCMLLSPGGDVQRSVEQSASLWGSLRYHLHLGAPEHKRREYYDCEHPRVDYVSGAFLLLRREALTAAGQFDEQFFMYAEEADLCLRIRQAGYAIAYSPAAKIVHLGGGSASSSRARSVQRLVSRLRFLKKHRAPLYYHTFRLLSMGRSVCDYAFGRLDRDGLRRILRAHCELSYGL